MNVNSFRYQLRIKRAVLEAHITAMTNTIDQIEYPHRDDYLAVADDYRMDEEEMFVKYWKIVTEID